MFFKRSMQVQWSQTGRVKGLLRATIERPAKGIRGITLKVDGQSFPVDISALPAGEPRLPVNIHTHLIADGPAKLAFELQAEDGKYASAVETVTVGNPGPLAARVRESLRKKAVPLAYAGPCDSGRYDYADPALRPWFDREDADEHVQALLDAGQVSADEAAQLRAFVRDGFLVLPDGIEDALVDRALADMQDAVDTGYQGYRWGESTRLEHLHEKYPAMRELWLHPRVHRMLELIFDEVSQPCQSLGYVFGSQQDAHQDTIHLTPFPAGYMCGVWIALEDVQPGSGELMVYPGSHRLPRVYMQGSGCEKVTGTDWQPFGNTVVKRWAELLRESAIAPMPYMARKGSVLVWHENLMHAGSVRRDASISRRSLVCHNFARGCVVYYDSSGAVGGTFDRSVASAASLPG